MATRQEIESILALTRPRDNKTLLTNISALNKGIGGVLRILYRADPDRILTSGDIGAALGITSARTAVMLGKMEKLGFITKRKSANDARRTEIYLTESGKEASEKLRAHFISMISEGIDTVGYDRMREFIITMNELCDAIPFHDMSDIVPEE